MHNVYDICCVGHITLDKIVTPKNTAYMPGGTAFYFTNGIKRLNDTKYKLATALGRDEMNVVEDFRSEGIDVDVMPSDYSVYFENIYGENQNNRTQKVLAKGNPFTVDFLENINAKIFHLGALLADDFSIDIIKHLSKKGLVSVDSQGYLREVRGTDVYPVDWADKVEALKYVHFLKVNEHELEALTGHTDIVKGAKMLYDWGVREVLVTLGSMGSVIYDGKEYYKIPAYIPSDVVDATGCGDTYTLGYLYQRSQNADIEFSGKFAAAMATIKIESLGPFKGTKADVMERIETAATHMPEL